MKIWELSLEEIGLTSFYLPEDGAQKGFEALMDNLYEDNKPIIEKWEPFVLLKEEQKVDPDFFDLYDTGSLIVSLDAAAVLALSMPDNDYEMLPFMNDEDTYVLINHLKYTDCLNKKDSVYETFDNGLISDYKTLLFDSEMAFETPFFRIPELPYTIFVTHIFKYFYDTQGLKGLIFDDDNLVFVD